MEINWKLRFQNKTTLLALATIVVVAAYQVMGTLGIIPPISQDAIIQIIGYILTLLVALGIVVDPTTEGVTDSSRALEYTQPAENAENERDC